MHVCDGLAEAAGHEVHREGRAQQLQLPGRLPEALRGRDDGAGREPRGEGLHRPGDLPDGQQAGQQHPVRLENGLPHPPRRGPGRQRHRQDRLRRHREGDRGQLRPLRREPERWRARPPGVRQVQGRPPDVAKGDRLPRPGGRAPRRQVQAAAAPAGDRWGPRGRGPEWRGPGQPPRGPLVPHPPRPRAARERLAEGRPRERPQRPLRLPARARQCSLRRGHMAHGLQRGHQAPLRRHPPPAARWRAEEARRRAGPLRGHGRLLGRVHGPAHVPGSPQQHRQTLRGSPAVPVFPARRRAEVDRELHPARH
mmetsp:Transcript_109808/g.310350  ORF Transcript_109808/g.310350 Transcript_109808/m.310350 type:complete len:310 (+) Transcript_109808:2591-3520(+)